MKKTFYLIPGEDNNPIIVDCDGNIDQDSNGIHVLGAVGHKFKTSDKYTPHIEVTYMVSFCKSIEEARSLVEAEKEYNNTFSK